MLQQVNSYHEGLPQNSKVAQEKCSIAMFLAETDQILRSVGCPYRLTQAQSRASAKSVAKR